MNFLESINRIRHSRQYQKKFDALMWLSKYKRCHHGRNINVKKLCLKCNINNYEYECVMAGSPLASIPDCNKVIQYMKSAYYDSLNKFVFWRQSNQFQINCRKSDQHHIVQNTSDGNKYFINTWISNDFSDDFNDTKRFGSPSYTKPVQVFKSES